MLKQRILYLCRKKGISRQKLTEGLITQTHFSNILAGRYALAGDLAEAMAKRLSTSPEYIMKAANWSDEDVNKVDELAQVAFSEILDESIISSLPVVANELSVEIAANIAAVCILTRNENIVKIEEIQTEYLDFYLSEFNDENIEAFHPSLQKMLYLYKSLVYSSEEKFQTALVYLDKLLEIVEYDSDAFIYTQFYRTVAFVSLEMFDIALETTDILLLRIRKENRLNHLARLHILRSAIFDKIQLEQQTMVELAKAEESMMYLSDPLFRGRILAAILHNRIVTATDLHYFDIAEQTIERTQEMLSLNGSISDEIIKQRISFYKASLLLEQENWEALTEVLDKLQSMPEVPNSSLIIHYCRGVMLYEQKHTQEAEAFLVLVEKEMTKNILAVKSIARVYIMLAEISESDRKYKQAAEYYKKAYEAMK